MLTLKLQRFIIPCLTLWLLGTSAAWAQTNNNNELNIEAAETKLKSYALMLENATRVDEAAQAGRDILSLRVKLSECLSAGEANLARLDKSLSFLGDESLVDSASIIEQRAELDVKRERFRVRNSSCKLLEIKAQELLNTANQVQRKLSAERLSRRNHSIADHFVKLKNNPAHVWASVSEPFVIHKDTLPNMSKRWPWGLLAFMALSGLGLGLQKLLDMWLSNQRGRGGQPTHLMVFMRSLLPNVFWIMFGVGLLAFARISLRTFDLDFLLTRFAIAFASLALARSLIRWYTSANGPGNALVQMPAENVTLVRSRIWRMILVLGIGYMILGHNWFAQPSPTERPFWRILMSLLLTATTVQVLILSFRVSLFKGRFKNIRRLAFIGLMGAVLSELIGMHNLANYLYAGLLLSFISFLLLWTCLWIEKQFIDGIQQGQSKLSYKARAWFGIRQEESAVELGWLRLFINMSLWIGLAIVLIWGWDVTGNAISTLKNAMLNGISFRDHKFVPTTIAIGIVVFVGVLLATTWLKALLSKKWLRDMGMERGARDAVTALVGYVGFIAALLAGMTFAGVSFKGLALIAGALSVGIGFGLQNIVNNFVSGLILLFERPIKSGDFVSVGLIEGTVKRIRIRSTEIETLNRQNVIVPNSELTSTQVTNWVLHDNLGRLNINFGVAYGSDTLKVKDIVEAIANEHPEAVTQGRTPTPKCLFMAFGESSLDFELRIWVRNIEKRFEVRSDINFAIEKAFREHHIQIPFPQRDIHIKETK